MTTLTIKTATASEADPVIAVLTLAFSTDPGVRWTYPDPQQYLRHFPSLVQAFGGNAIAHGSAYYVDGYAGAALWLPPEVHPDEDAMNTLLQHTVPEQVHKDLLAVFEQVSPYLPQEPYWYLPLIGVDPCHQGKGYGAALMQHALVPCDRDHLPAYLESTNPKNISLYERHGFKVLGTVQVGTSPTVCPMLRRPR
jgi:ribosomal protein S18 acetylase RimI-like enzyme